MILTRSLKHLRENWLQWDYVILYNEVTPHCNNRCVFCPIDLVERGGFISRKTQERVIGFLRNNSQIKFRIYFHLLGEPLLFKGLEAYISRMQLSNVEIWLCTNGILLTPQRLASLQSAGLRNLWYSIFYTNETDYKKFVRTSHFSKANLHLQHLIAKCETMDRVHIVSFSDNVSEIRSQIQGKLNITIERRRRLREWRFEGLFGGSKKLIHHSLAPFTPKYLCISSSGDVVFDWKNYQFSQPFGSIHSLDDETIMNGYFNSNLNLRLQNYLFMNHRRVNLSVS